MSSNGFMGWVQKNPGTAFAIFLVFAAIVTVIVMVARSPAPSAGPGAASDLPVLEVSGTKVVKSTKTSGYAMRYEYALGEKLGDNIDFTITIDTKSGFEQNKISRLKVFRYGPNAAGKKGELLGTKIIDDIKNFTTYDDVTFLGQELLLDAVPPEGGKQFFEVIGYVVSDDGAETEYIVDPITLTSVLASTPADEDDAPKISGEDLNYVLSSANRTDFVWTVSGASELRFAKSEALKSKYTLSIEPSRPVLLIPGTDSMYTFRFADAAGGSFTVDGVTQFKLDQPNTDEEVYLMYATKANETTPGIVTRQDGVIDGALVLKDPKMMTGVEFAMAKVTITELPTGPQCWSTYTGDDCVNLDGNYGAATKNIWRLDPSNPDSDAACAQRARDMACGGFQTIWTEDADVKNQCWSTYSGDDCAVLDGNYGAATKGAWRLDPYKPDSDAACAQRARDMACGGFQSRWQPQKPS